MTISEQLTALANIKADIKQAIIDKGVTISDSDAFSTYADKISSLSGGGSKIDVTFYSLQQSTPSN